MPPKRRQSHSDASIPDSKRRQTRSTTKALSAAKEDENLKQNVMDSQPHKATKTVQTVINRKPKKGRPCAYAREREHDKATKSTKRGQKKTGSSKSLESSPKRPNAKSTKELQNPESDDTELKPTPITLSLTHESLKSPIHCELHLPLNPLPETANPSHTLIYTHGAGGTLATPTIQTFKTGYSRTSRVLLFQGSPNLASRVKAFDACFTHMNSQEGRDYPNMEWSEDTKAITFGGRSMGARAAVQAALDAKAPHGKIGPPHVDLVLMSYPLRSGAGSKKRDDRDAVRTKSLLDLQVRHNVLFIVGSRDAMCPLEDLQAVREKMKARNWLVVMEGLDHGMRGKGDEELGVLAGKLAAEWVEAYKLREYEDGSRSKLADIRTFCPEDGKRNGNKDEVE